MIRNPFRGPCIFVLQNFNKKAKHLTSNSICGWAGSFKFQIFTLWSKAIEIKMSWANGCHLTNWTLLLWADKVKWGSLTKEKKIREIDFLYSQTFFCPTEPNIFFYPTFMQNIPLFRNKRFMLDEMA